MFETVELGRKVSKEDFKARVPRLRTALLNAQQRLRRADFPAVVLFSGVDGAGKGDTANLLNEWMDPRWMVTRAYLDPSEEEQERPGFWRFWRDLPPRRHVGVFLSAWYSNPLLERAYGGKLSRFDRSLDEILDFETTLANDGALIVKFWMHLGKKQQKARFERLEKDPDQAWRVTEQDWRHLEMYDKFISTSSRLIMRTSTGLAPWHLIEGSDPRYRSLRVGELLLDALVRRLDEQGIAAEAPHRPALGSIRVPPSHKLSAKALAALELAEQEDTSVQPTVDPATAEDADKLSSAALLAAALRQDESAWKSDEQTRSLAVAEEEVNGELPPVDPDELTIFDCLDLESKLEPAAYKKRLSKLQAKLGLLHRRAVAEGVSTLLVFEGMDAAGKGGAIRRITASLDARYCNVIPIAAPTDEEKAQHYLWRFWRHLPRAGRVTIFDRSWYGRVLVERIEGFATEEEWRRAYAEMNNFEQLLTDHGCVVRKFWIHISAEEQLARFEARSQTPHKRWKLTDEDWRNRKRWRDYERAAHDMVERTSTEIAPWTVIEGNDKKYARIKVLETTCAALECALDRQEDEDD
jgi:AMP-polyphosphate phosphotransferase